MNEKLFKQPLDELITKVGCLSEAALMWTKTYSKLNQKEADNKFNKDKANILTREERKQCKHGEDYKVKKIMEKHQPTTNYSMDTILLVRNYLMLNIFIRNWHRAGVVANLKLFFLMPPLSTVYSKENY